MSSSALLRKDKKGGTKLGLIPVFAIGIVIALVIFLFGWRYTSQHKATVSRTPQITPKIEETRNAISSNKPIRVRDTNSNQNLNEKDISSDADITKTQTIIDSTSIPIPTKEDTPFIQTDTTYNDDVLALLNNTATDTTQKTNPHQIFEVADDGREFLRTRAGLFNSAVLPNTRLKDADNTPLVIGQDGELYLEDKNNVTLPLKNAPKPPIINPLNGCFYTYNNQKLMLKTPGGPGSFRGPDGKSYQVLPDSTLVETTVAGTTLPVNNIGGSGEFKGTDSNIYYLISGTLFQKNTEDVSFSQNIITGVGFFLDPAGNNLRRSNDGKIYIPNGKDIVRTNIKGYGLFKGPDGSDYRKEKDGKISLIQASQLALRSKDQDTTISQIQGGSYVVANANNLQYLQRSNTANASDGDMDTMENTEKVKGQAPQNSGNSNNPGFLWQPKSSTITQLEDTEDENTNDVPVMMPGKRIPFFTGVAMSSRFDGANYFEAYVSENVYFFGAHIPAGSKLIGTQSGVSKNNRITINFTQLQIINKKGRTVTTYPLSGQVFDVNEEPGLEVYYKPPPPWLIGLRYSNAYAVYKVQESSPVDQNNRSIGNAQPIVDAIQKTQSDLELRYSEFYYLPRGSVGIFILTAPLILEKGLTAKELAKAMSTAKNSQNIPQDSSEELLAQRMNDLGITYDSSNTTMPSTNNTTQVKSSNVIPNNSQAAFQLFGN